MLFISTFSSIIVELQRRLLLHFAILNQSRKCPKVERVKQQWESFQWLPSAFTARVPTNARGRPCHSHAKGADERLKILKVMHYSNDGVSRVACVLEVLIGAVASIIGSYAHYF